jgi:hypothetical protein
MGFTQSETPRAFATPAHSETTYDDVLIRNCIGFDLYFLDSGIYTVRNAQVISSAAKAFYLQGREVPAEPCRVTLDNVLIRREGTASEVRVSANCLLKAEHLTLLNLDVQATGGTIELSQSFIGGEIPVADIQLGDAASDKPRKPNLHLWKDAVWYGNGNWYDLYSARVDRVTFSQSEFEGFTQAVRQSRALAGKQEHPSQLLPSVSGQRSLLERGYLRIRGKLQTFAALISFSFS